MLKNAWWLFVSIIVCLLDFVSKHYVFTKLKPYEAISVTPFFNITLAFNKGAAFSFLSAASGWQNVFFIGVGCAISAVLIVWLHKLTQAEKWQGLAISLILGGALGNIYDRIQFGFVIDFLDLHIGQYHWPIFNLADSAICIGALLMLYFSWQDSKVLPNA